ncbi:hypothetical protein AKJ16_DCAP11366 [Drosera capensis]
MIYGLNTFPLFLFSIPKTTTKHRRHRHRGLKSSPSFPKISSCSWLCSLNPKHRTIPSFRSPAFSFRSVRGCAPSIPKSQDDSILQISDVLSSVLLQIFSCFRSPSDLVSISDSVATTSVQSSYSYVFIFFLDFMSFHGGDFAYGYLLPLTVFSSPPQDAAVRFLPITDHFPTDLHRPDHAASLFDGLRYYIGGVSSSVLSFQFFRCTSYSERELYSTAS